MRDKKRKTIQKLYGELERLAHKYKVGADAIALQFCGQTLPTSILLSGASNTTQLLENLKLNTFRLSEDEIQDLASFKIDPISYWEERKQLKWN